MHGVDNWGFGEWFVLGMFVWYVWALTKPIREGLAKIFSDPIFEQANKLKQARKQAQEQAKKNRRN